MEIFAAFIIGVVAGVVAMYKNRSKIGEIRKILKAAEDRREKAQDTLDRLRRSL